MGYEYFGNKKKFRPKPLTWWEKAIRLLKESPELTVFAVIQLGWLLYYLSGIHFIRKQAKAIAERPPKKFKRTAAKKRSKAQKPEATTEKTIKRSQEPAAKEELKAPTAKELDESPKKQPYQPVVKEVSKAPLPKETDKSSNEQPHQIIEKERIDAKEVKATTEKKQETSHQPVKKEEEPEKQEPAKAQVAAYTLPPEKPLKAKQRSKSAISKPKRSLFKFGKSPDPVTPARKPAPEAEKAPAKKPVSEPKPKQTKSKTQISKPRFSLPSISLFRTRKPATPSPPAQIKTPKPEKVKKQKPETKPKQKKVSPPAIKSKKRFSIPIKLKMPPPIWLWIIISYLVVFAIAEFRFRLHYDRLMDDIEHLEQQLVQADKTSRQSFVQLIETLPALQNRHCPKDPEFLNPISIIGSFAVSEINQETLVKTMEVFSQWKTKLGHINLDKPIFRDFDLDGLVLSGSRLTLPHFQNVSLKNADFSESEILLGVFERIQLDQANFNGALVAYSSFSDNEEHWLLSKNSSGSNDQKPDLGGVYLLSVNLRNFSVDSLTLTNSASLYKSALSVKSCDEVSRSNKTLFSPPTTDKDDRLKKMEQFAKTYQFEADNPLAAFLSNMTGKTCVR